MDVVAVWKTMKMILTDECKERMIVTVAADWVLLDQMLLLSKMTKR